MKTQRSVAKKRRQIERAQESPTLKADELIDFLAKSCLDSSGLVNKVMASTITILLFLNATLDAVECDGNDVLKLPLKDKTIEYCSIAGAVGDIIQGLPAVLYEAREQVEAAAFAASAAVRNYKKQHPKPATA